MITEQDQHIYQSTELGTKPGDRVQCMLGEKVNKYGKRVKTWVTDGSWEAEIELRLDCIERKQHVMLKKLDRSVKLLEKMVNLFFVK